MCTHAELNSISSKTIKQNSGWCGKHSFRLDEEIATTKKTCCVSNVLGRRWKSERSLKCRPITKHFVALIKPIVSSLSHAPSLATYCIRSKLRRFAASFEISKTAESYYFLSEYLNMHEKVAIKVLFRISKKL